MSVINSKSSQQREQMQREPQDDESITQRKDLADSERFLAEEERAEGEQQSEGEKEQELASMQERQRRGVQNEEGEDHGETGGAQRGAADDDGEQEEMREGDQVVGGQGQDIQGQIDEQKDERLSQEVEAQESAGVNRQDLVEQEIEAPKTDDGVENLEKTDQQGEDKDEELPGEEDPDDLIQEMVDEQSDPSVVKEKMRQYLINKQADLEEEKEDQIDSATQEYDDETRQQALEEHVEEIQLILADFPSEEAERAAIELLYGEHIEIEDNEKLGEICELSSSTPLRTFCSENPNPTSAMLQEFLRGELYQKLFEIKAALNQKHFTNMARTMADDIIREEEFQDHEEYVPQNLHQPLVEPSGQLGSTDNMQSFEMGYYWLMLIPILMAIYYIIRRSNILPGYKKSQGLYFN